MTFDYLKWCQGGNYQIAVRKVRNWLTNNIAEIPTVSANSILAKYEDFQEWHYERQREKGFSEQDIKDYPTSELLDEMLNCLIYTSHGANQCYQGTSSMTY